jgi:hypothetical protein
MDQLFDTSDHSYEGFEEAEPHKFMDLQVVFLEFLELYRISLIEVQVPLSTEAVAPSAG